MVAEKKEKNYEQLYYSFHDFIKITLMWTSKSLILQRRSLLLLQSEGSRERIIVNTKYGFLS